ncbi:ATP-dependent RNA helicase SUV3 mitochondrial precursor [Macroventuria anomochaeta]|uniref:ATP-dependent RNA helicase SUV3 mitochondrial n=1 Tax=Macroventuria anomochaeta TaxID=301207 RepID=A0ACB6SAJ7_9PLEO|nr:ATP-dependent RNA helicase SUV3 mitochondrial precursor [Macroventuria anomochaeta]KAF2631246.1 ATP-dependent RNA helicase SUV3 mitochondrial precursor [Macroventuria anomochaeta]
MSALPARRSSLCLFCAFAARPSQPQRLLPRIQVAYRGTSSKSKSGNNSRVQSARPAKSASFNPLNSGRRGVPARPPADTLRTTVDDKLSKLRSEFTEPAFLDSLQLDQDQFGKEWHRFENSINAWVKQASSELIDLVHQASRGKATLETRLRYLFYAQTCGGRFTNAELENQKEVADLRYPAEWYPATREVPRVVHMHVGPTNSGKTYHALQRLEAAKSGIYLGPLRLLAHEVFTRLNAKGKSCALVTGEEQRMPEGDAPPMYSCTVEMAPLNTKFDVAVIDEIQMINHPERGWAWTQAFLGLQAREIHLCGEARTVNIMRELCALVGDEVHVHEYERLTPLQVQPRSLYGKLNKLEKGDCVVAFTVVGIHALRREIEKQTGKKCAIVYGSLPPETRAQQARLFNDPDNEYDYLVASDAIGMGLNLAIKRVIFESTMKSDGVKYVPLQVSEIKQIAGRAGRYKTAADAVSDNTPSANGETKVAKKEKTVGWCTTLDQIDLDVLKEGMSREPDPIKTAGLFPPSLIVERFANYFPPGTPFSYILLRLHEISEIHPRFHLCGLKEQLAIADAIHTIKGLSIQDRIMITSAPCNMRDKAEKIFLRTLAECIAEGKSGNLLELPNLPLNVMDEPARGDRKYLYSLEQLHKMVVLYLWLSYRFPNVFTTRSLAVYTKKLLEDQIESTLTEFSHTELRLKQKEKRERDRLKRSKEAQEAVAELRGKMPAPPGMPEEAKDILNDKNAFAEASPATDDVDEYPEEPVDESEKADELDTILGDAEVKERRSANL